MLQPPHPHIQLTNDELDAIIDLIWKQYGYDFSHYARASLMRRVTRCMLNAGFRTGYELKYHLTNDRNFFYWFLQTLTVNVTEMFRDPVVYRELREKVLPKLASYPVIKVWHAGCATGEEVFSMAILLHEAGLLNRARLYATDINPANLEQARKGMVPVHPMKEYAHNYQQAGGRRDFTGYFTFFNEGAEIKPELRKDIIFAQHNLVSDQVFNEFQLIICRNVMIYFDKVLQNRVTTLFYDSLSPLGYLMIGMKESLLFTNVSPHFEETSAGLRIYRRKK
ncbi:CheR family methyltransferase [Arsenicibacter rosenii]|uniref:Chemotaxis protein CheR n=1 Tax=Arsenicibacter rosenii TaxID=1750698 RepID=A0A1S2VQ25_9BACT|nr:protein-glutamate O-methyltransferase CheR [Arsenicibacter rosenii]OIN60871.1 chemotaxis protein CheR [Arsenicibacter rosenii]